MYVHLSASNRGIKKEVSLYMGRKEVSKERNSSKEIKKTNMWLNHEGSKKHALTMQWIATSFPSLNTTLVVVVQVKQRKEMNKLLPIVHMGDFGHMGKWKKAQSDTGPNSKLFRACWAQKLSVKSPSLFLVWLCFIPNSSCSRVKSEQSRAWIHETG